MFRFDIPQSENSRKTGRYLPVQHRYSSSKQPRHFAAQTRGTIRRYAPYVALNLNQGPDDSGLRPYIADLAIFENREGEYLLDLLIQPLLTGTNIPNTLQ